MDTKKDIRDLCRKIRSGMGREEVSEKSGVICRKLLDHPAVQSANQILAYSAIRNEVDLTPFVELAWKMGKRVYFPRTEGESMEFYEVSAFDAFAEGRFHVMEPVKADCPLCPDQNAVICVPGVAFSRSGNRIGFGKGYYDRYLDKYPYLYKIGLAYEFQTEYRWKPEDCDVAMDLLITEKEIPSNECDGIMQKGT